MTVIERTRNITNYVTADNRVVNRSISVERIEQVTGTKVERFKVNEVNRLAAVDDIAGVFIAPQPFLRVEGFLEHLGRSIEHLPSSAGRIFKAPVLRQNQSLAETL